MTCIAEFKHFDADGSFIEGGQLRLPDSLDWLDIRVKAHYYKLRGAGSPRTEFVLLGSQGQQHVIYKPNLEGLDYRQLEDKEHGIQSEIEDFIKRGGHSKVPRNQ